MMPHCFAMHSVGTSAIEEGLGHHYRKLWCPQSIWVCHVNYGTTLMCRIKKEQYLIEPNNRDFHQRGFIFLQWNVFALVDFGSLLRSPASLAFFISTGGSYCIAEGPSILVILLLPSYRLVSQIIFFLML